MQLTELNMNELMTQLENQNLIRKPKPKPWDYTEIDFGNVHKHAIMDGLNDYGIYTFKQIDQSIRIQKFKEQDDTIYENNPVFKGLHHNRIKVYSKVYGDYYQSLTDFEKRQILKYYLPKNHPEINLDDAKYFGPWVTFGQNQLFQIKIHINSKTHKQQVIIEDWQAIVSPYDQIMYDLGIQKFVKKAD